MIDMASRHRYRQAARRVKQLYPGPVGEYLSREIETYEEWGYRIDSGVLVVRLVEHVMNTPIPVRRASCP